MGGKLGGLDEDFDREGVKDTAHNSPAGGRCQLDHVDSGVLVRVRLTVYV